MNLHMLSSQSPWKKLLAVGLMALLTLGTAFALVGCSNNDDAQRIEELEAEVERLQNEQNAITPEQAPVTDTAAVQSDDGTIQGYSDRAEDLISRAKAAEVPGDSSARIDAFFALDSEFNQLETELDSYENQKEAEYRNGSLTWDQYRSLELQLEQIEDRLDNAQDSLEIRFGIDD